MKIRFLGQSGYVINTATTEIIIDPYLSDSVNRVASRPRTLPIPILPQDIRADAVICTHNHLDHLDPDTVSGIRDSQLFITTKEGVGVLKKMGKSNAVAPDLGCSVTVSDTEITAVFADHTVEAIGVVLRAEGKTLYFSGDTLYNQRLFDIAAYRPDITFICINGRLGNMNVDEAVATAKAIGARVSVPNHYDMFASNSEDPTLFTSRVQNSFIMEFNKTYDVDKIIAR